MPKKKMKKMKYLVAATVLTVGMLNAAELHVSPAGNDQNSGSRDKPFQTISAAANVAQPGDVVTVHAGVYRERVNPPRGGTSDTNRITYQAAPGEKVTITGSEPVKRWEKVSGNTWKVVIPNKFFGDFNPYADRICGDWFNPKGRQHHTGSVYLNGEWLTEAASHLNEVLAPAGKTPLWFAKVDNAEDNTTLWAQFPGVNPNDSDVEINVRKTVFTPEKVGINYITVRGFTLRNAATNWAPPTAGQIGLITAYWNKGWIIENNTISHSVCSGISLGKHCDKFDNTSADSAEGYVKTIERAHAHEIPWTKENIGHHIVRNNTISHCEQTGIVGSLGSSFSTITGNIIHDIHMRQLFTGAEMAGIKLHGAIDTTISRNHIYRTNRGIWLDWMAQGTRVSCNLLHDNDTNEDLFSEVNHGPLLVDNNIFLSRVNILDVSQGCAFVHNLFTGKIQTKPEHGRDTPFHPPHSTKVAGLCNIQGGDNRFYNNIFVGDGTAGTGPAKEGTQRHTALAYGYGLSMYDSREAPLQTGGNIHLNGTKAYAKETNPIVLDEKNPGVKLIQQDRQFVLQGDFSAEFKHAATVPVTTDLLGMAKASNGAYENPDGSPLKIDTDYLGNKRDEKNPLPGPLEITKEGQQKIQVWPNP